MRIRRKVGSYHRPDNGKRRADCASASRRVGSRLRDLVADRVGHRARVRARADVRANGPVTRTGPFFEYRRNSPSRELVLDPEIDAQTERYAIFSDTLLDEPAHERITGGRGRSRREVEVGALGSGGPGRSRWALLALRTLRTSRADGALRTRQTGRARDALRTWLTGRARGASRTRVALRALRAWLTSRARNTCQTHVALRTWRTGGARCARIALRTGLTSRARGTCQTRVALRTLRTRGAR